MRSVRFARVLPLTCRWPIRAPSVDRHTPPPIAAAAEDVDPFPGVGRDSASLLVRVGRLVRVALERPVAVHYETDRGFLPARACRAEILGQPLAHSWLADNLRFAGGLIDDIVSETGQQS